MTTDQRREIGLILQFLQISSMTHSSDHKQDCRWRNNGSLGFEAQLTAPSPCPCGADERANDRFARDIDSHIGLIKK